MNAITRKLVAAMVLCALVCALTQTAMAAEKKEPWEDNLLTKETFAVFDMDLERIESVTFLDTLKDAPEYTWYMGKYANKNVQAWFTWENGIGQAYFAAEGGINGKDAAEGLFKDLVNLKEVNFNGAFHTEQAESFREMFYGCENLETVDLSTLDTSNVTTMREMFRDCHRLKEIDVSSFDTSKVTMLYAMFSNCLTLKKLDLSAFDTANVTNIGYMFSACSGLEEVNVSTWDTSKVNYMEGTFLWCDKLQEPDLDSWKVDNVRIYRDFMNRGAKIDGQDWKLFFNR